MNEPIRKQIVETSREYFDIITEKKDEFGYSDVNIDDCCNSDQIKLLAETIDNYIQESKTKQNTLLIVQVIVYLYFHLVLIETQDNDLLETSFILEHRPQKVKQAFQKLLRNIMFGNEPKYAHVRQKFLAFNTESFRDTLTPITPSHLKSAWQQLPLSQIKADEVGDLYMQSRKSSSLKGKEGPHTRKRLRKGGKSNSRKGRSV